MKDRIKKLRKALGLTQQEFADRLGISRGNIATYETREGNPGSSVITLICREFNVSETWLRTGEGKMFVPEETDAWEEVVKRRGLSDSDRLLIEKFMALKPAEREVVMKYVLSVATDYAAPDTNGQERAQSDVAARVEELERQNKELAAKVAAMEEEDAKMEAAAELSLGKPFSGGTKTG